MITNENIKLDKYLKPQKRETMNDVYKQALASLCNRDRMSNYIKFEDRQAQLREVLFNFTPLEVKEKYDERIESLINVLNEKLSLKIDHQKKRSLGVIFAEGIISAARFFSEFKDKKDFDNFVKGFQTNKYSRQALPMLLDKEIDGFGFALACDFLKEAGYDCYPKPDVHLMDVFKKSGLCERNNYKVFKTIIEMAEIVGKTPYEVDKRIWLVCTGKFYYDKKADYKNKKKELLQRLGE